MDAPDRLRRAVVKAIGAAIVVSLAPAALPLARAAEAAPSEPSTLHPLMRGVWISGQIAPAQVAALKAHGIERIVALRPDGEEPGQPTSAAVEAAARSAGIAFAYAPVPGKDVPQAAVDAVSRALARPDEPVVIYCKSGHRATRTWALAEASRVDGLEADAIQSVAASAGQPVEDLREQIAARVATRRVLDVRGR